MSPDEQTEFLKLIALSKRLTTAADRFLFEVISPPNPKSAIAEARRLKQSDAFDLAGLLLFSAQDHLRTFVTVGETPTIPSYGLFSLLRIVAEAAARASYLLEVDVPHAQRLARGLNERLDNLKEQGKIVLDQKEVSRRISSLEARATQLGIPIHRGKNGDVVWFGHPFWRRSCSTPSGI